MSEKNKALQKQSFIMDINILEAPFFLFNQSTKAIRVKDIKNNPDITKEVSHVLSLTNNDNGEIKYFKWTDSKGLLREMMAISPLNLPRKFAMDVWYGIVGLYIKKSSPINYDYQLNIFDINENKLYFTLYELAKFMKLSTGGANIKKIKDAIRELTACKYYSFANGSIYNKKFEEYLHNKEDSLSLINNYHFSSEQRRGDPNSIKTKCWVELNSLIVDNIKHEFIKYLNSETYFTLPSGLTRGLYTYLEGNKYSSNGMLTYIKRNFEVLANKIPIEYKFNSDLKKKLKRPLENLMKYGIISDYFYGDKDIINKKEPCIYFVFKGHKESVINTLRRKYEEKQLKSLEDNTTKKEFQMKIPKNLDKTLEEIGFSSKVIKQLYIEHDKWEIIKYVIWLQDQKSKNTGSIKNSAGLLIFALMGNVNLDISNKDIVDFVENEKKRFEDSKLSHEEILKNAYDSYINQEIEKLKKEEDGTYNIIYENTLINIEAQLNSQLQQLKLLKVNEGVEVPSLKLWEEFQEKKDKSELFKKNLINSIKVFSGIMTFEEFQVEFEKNHEI